MTQQTDRLNVALTGHYTVERELGQGGMATVYLALDVRHDRKVALKVLREDLSASLGKERFLREVKVAAALQHPHILPLHDSGEADGLLFYVMPFVDGLSLREKLVKEGELPVNDAVRILRDVADALSEAHKHGVVHRDLKPENVMISGRHALVTDFGVAKALSDATGRQSLTTIGVALGTPTYMAPEQATADPHLDHRADIYAFGVMAYELLSGRPPFTGVSPQQILAAHVTAAAEPVSAHRTMSPALASLVMRCLEKKPADRWQSADALVEQLEALLTPSGGMTPTDTQPLAATTGPGVASAAPGRTTPAPIGSWTRKRVGVTVIAAAIVIALVAYVVQTGRFGGASPSAKPPTLAVLPFENLGAADDEYFADGMTEELTGRLAKLSGLAVIARTSVLQYKKTTKTIPQIARELGADYLIEGAVRWEKNADGTGRVRIAPQVARAKDGTHVWSEKYDQPYGTAIFEIQSDIAERVADALSVTLLAREQKAVRAVPTRNLQAYDYFLRGQTYSARDMVGVDWEAQRLALESYQQAVKLDPGFALAHAWVATTDWKMSWSYDLSLPTGVTGAQRSEMARQAAERALALDPDLPRAHSVLADYYRIAAGDTTRSLEELGRALRGDPSDPQSVADRGWALFYRGERDEGTHGLERAVALDPRNPGRLLDVAQAVLFAHDYRTAEEYYDRAITVSPDAPETHLWKVWINLLQGRVERAHAAMREGVRQVGVSKLLFQVSLNTPWLPIFRILDDEYGPAAKQLSWDTFGLDSADYYLTMASTYRKNGIRGPAYYDSVAAWAEPRVRRGGESNPLLHILWAIGLAGSGKRAAAVREISLLRADKRYVWSAFRYELTAEACVLAVLYDCAIEESRLAMTEPWTLNPYLLKLDPIWDPLRGRADFQKLVEQK